MINEPLTYTTAFVVGLLGGAHCIGMCGPIAFILPFDRTNKVKQFFQIIVLELKFLLQALPSLNNGAHSPRLPP